jgi:Ca2+-binding RTX toxin-like protein
VNAGTINAFVQTGGISNFTGTNAIYFTNWLQSQGITTIDTTSIGEYTAATKTLFDGIFEAQGTGSIINMGGSGGKLVVDIATVNGPKAVPTQDFWTQLIFDDPGSEINEWNGTAYVPVESTITQIGESGIITVTGGRDYTTANALTIGNDGLFEETSGTLTTGGLTIAIGGILSSGLLAPHTGVTTASTDAGPLVVAGSIVNDGTIQAYGGGIDVTGAITGTGSLTFDAASGSRLELNSVSAGEVVALNGNDTLVLDTPSSFGGTITASGAGNSIVLENTGGDSARIAGGTLQVTAGGKVIDSIAVDGDVTGTKVTLATSSLSVLDTTTNQPVAAVSQPYTGPVAGLTSQYINVTPDSLNISVSTPGWFLHSGAGEDAIAVSSGINVVDGSTGSNFLTSGSGTDTFFVDDRAATASIWDTIVNFHVGDSATIWGVTPGGFSLAWADGQGAAGYTGLTLTATAPGQPAALLTLAGFSQADLASGRLSISYGTSGGSPYMYVHANS